jgi:hypothetical protein
MSFNIENIFGIDNELINQLNSNNQNHLFKSNGFYRRGLNSLFIKSACVLIVFICVLGFYSYYSFLNLIYDSGISFLISAFLTFFMFNIYRLLFCGTFGPAKNEKHNESNTNFITYFFKYFFLITIGSLFSYITYAVFFQKTNILNYAVNHPDMKLDIITIFLLVNKLGGALVIIGFLLLIVVFLLPQLIVDFSLDKQRLKNISRDICENHLNKILSKNSNLKSSIYHKEDWRQQKLFEISNRTILSSSNLKRDIGYKLYDYLLNKQF